MQAELDALRAQQDELTTLLRGRPEGDWRRPSACVGWSVGDVVLHLVQTNEMATASAEGRFDEVLASPLYAPDPGATTLDDVVDLAVQRGRGPTPDELLSTWVEGAAALVEALSRCSSPRVRWVVGELSPRTLATTRLAETWIHTTDVAAGLGVDLAPTARLELVARLAWRTLPHAFAREGRTLQGPVGFDLVGVDGSSWRFGMDDGDEPSTIVTGDGVDLCRVAARRVDPGATGLVAAGSDAADVLALVRTWA